jgi:Flp pilus assembly protein TadG
MREIFHRAPEQGAILIQTAVASLALFGFGAFVFDYGLYWTSRAQAQNAADAGAMAGAISRAYDDLDDPPAPGSIVTEVATAVARQNQVWTATLPPAAVVVSSVCPIDAVARCVRVDVHRDTETGNPLPTVFGPIWGISSQSVKATATAVVRVGDTTNCLRPWAIPDRWVEHRPADGPWTPTSQFDRYAAGGPLGTLLPSPPPAWDVYVPPTGSSTGTGLTTGDDPAMTLTFSPLASPVLVGALQPLDLPGPNTYVENIAGCNGKPVSIGQELPISATATEPQTTSGWNDLIALDPAATWNAGTRTIESSCAPGCGQVSPRLIALAAYDVDFYARMAAVPDWSPCSTPGPCVRVANIFGFFINSVTSPGVVSGYLTSYPGLTLTVTPPLPLGPASSFLKAITLVR